LVLGPFVDHQLIRISDAWLPATKDERISQPKQISCKNALHFVILAHQASLGRG
jgi:hypothetical protein